jgi:hypothetical protein
MTQALEFGLFSLLRLHAKRKRIEHDAHDACVYAQAWWTLTHIKQTPD